MLPCRMIKVNGKLYQSDPGRILMAHTFRNEGLESPYQVKTKTKTQLSEVLADGKWNLEWITE